MSPKVATHRQATVQCLVHMSSEAFEAIRRHTLKKGDAFPVAKIAGIQAAKRTSELIPLCHPLPIEHLELSFDPQASTQTICVTAQATTTAKTGIELEAFVAAAVAALTLYDMVKAIDPAATITDLRLLRKTGGKEPFIRLSPVTRLARSSVSRRNQAIHRIDQQANPPNGPTGQRANRRTDTCAQPS